MSFPHTDFEVTASDGLKLKSRTYLVPKGTTEKAKILYVHGFSEHTAAYEHWFPKIAEAGYEVTFYDQRGFGLTAVNQSAYGVTTNALALTDINDMVDTVYKDYKGPLLLWGHSMGGGITLYYMVVGTYRERFCGYIANSPYITLHPDSYDWKAMFVPVINILAPWFRSPVPLKPEYCTNDEELLVSYPTDKLRHNIISVTCAHAMVMRGKDLLKPKFTKNIVNRPLLLSHGTSDSICDYTASQQFIDSVELSDKTFKSYEGWLHELMHMKQENKEVHMADVLAWLDAHEKVFNTANGKL